MGANLAQHIFLRLIDHYNNLFLISLGMGNNLTKDDSTKLNANKGKFISLGLIKINGEKIVIDPYILEGVLFIKYYSIKTLLLNYNTTNSSNANYKLSINEDKLDKSKLETDKILHDFKRIRDFLIKNINLDKVKYTNNNEDNLMTKTKTKTKTNNFSKAS
jgi:hypothetical protein